jgi:hypothetical protein
MAFKKLGENLDFGTHNLLSSNQALSNKEITLRFIKLAKNIKKVAPRAQDFLYGECVMMHAAEASLIDQSTGNPIMVDGKPVLASFEKIKLDNGKDSVKWVCSKEDLKPYKNANGDIFPEEELIKAHKKWIGKPLCKDHKSDSVDGIRGIIIDTYYDPKLKRVSALFALDRKNYGDLARKVETGYANAVSMGTAVGRSVCTDCGNVASTEREYCNCIRARKNYGEINLDLNPIELSLVVNGADGLAKVKNIVASMNNYVQTKQARLTEMVAQKCVNPSELQGIADSINDMQTKLNGLMEINKSAEAPRKDLGEMVAALKELRKEDGSEEAINTLINEIENLVSADKTDNDPNSWASMTGGGTEPSMAGENDDRVDNDIGERISPAPTNRLASTHRRNVMWGGEQPDWSKHTLKDSVDRLQTRLQMLDEEIKTIQHRLSNITQNEEGNQGATEQDPLRSTESNTLSNEISKVSKEENNMNSARLRARAKARRAYWLGGGGVNEPTPGKPKYEKEEADKIRDTEDKHMTGTVEMGSDGMYPGDEAVKKEMGRDGLNLSKAQLEERKMQRRAYWLGGGGVNEPTPGKPKYEKEEADKIRDTEDKHLETYDMGGTDGTVPGDMEVKKKLLRAKLRAKFTKVADDQGNLNKSASRWDIFAGDKLILSATGGEIYEDELDGNWDYLSSKAYGKDVIKHIRTDGFDRVAYLLKGAADPADPAAAGGGEMDLGAMPADPAAGAAPAPEAAPAEGAEDVRVEKPKDEMKTKVDTALSTMEEKIAEIRDLVSDGNGEELVDIDVTVEDQDAGGADKAPAEETPMEGALASRKDFLTVLALMDDSADELALASEALESGNSDRLTKAANQALEDSKLVLAQADVVLASKKKDEEEDKKDDDKDEKKEKKDDDKKKKEAGEIPEGLKKHQDKKKDKKDKKDDDEEDKKDDDEKSDKEKKAQRLLDEALKVRAQNRAALLAEATEMPVTLDIDEEDIKLNSADDGDYAKDKDSDKKDDDKDDEEDESDEDKKDDDDDALDSLIEDYADDVEEDEESMVCARRKMREELVAEATDKILGKYELSLDKAQNATEKTYFEAHPGGKGTDTELTHTKTPEAHVETISEVHDVMRDVAESGPRNVREAAAIIQEEIVKGAIKSEDLDKLVSEGKVDAAAASYWKKYFSQANGGSFGADLSKEFATKKKEASVDTLKVKIRRAYDLGLEAQDKGFIDATRASLDTYVDDLMKMDDAAFESTKRIISKMASSKKSGKLPRVTASAATEAMSVSANDSAEPDWLNGLSNLGWK